MSGLTGGLRVFDVLGGGGFGVRVFDLRASKAFVARALRAPRRSAGLEVAVSYKLWNGRFK